MIVELLWLIAGGLVGYIFRPLIDESEYKNMILISAVILIILLMFWTPYSIIALALGVLLGYFLRPNIEERLR